MLTASSRCTANGGGVGNGNSIVGATAGPTAASVVIHRRGPTPNKIACADRTDAPEAVGAARAVRAGGSTGAGFWVALDRSEVPGFVGQHVSGFLGHLMVRCPDGSRALRGERGAGRGSLSPRRGGRDGPIQVMGAPSRDAVPCRRARRARTGETWPESGPEPDACVTGRHDRLAAQTPRGARPRRRRLDDRLPPPRRRSDPSSTRRRSTGSWSGEGSSPPNPRNVHVRAGNASKHSSPTSAGSPT